MEKYEVMRTLNLTVEAGSCVFVSDGQYELVKSHLKRIVAEDPPSKDTAAELPAFAIAEEKEIIPVTADTESPAVIENYPPQEETKVEPHAAVNETETGAGAGKTKAELLTLAETLHITIAPGMTKAQILALLGEQGVN